MEKEEKGQFIKIIISTLLFAFTFIIKQKELIIAFYILSYVIISYEMYIEVFKHLLKKDIFDENFLMIIATLGAFYIGSYQEGILVILLFQIGEFLSDLTVSRSKESITKLMDLRVEEVLLEDKTTVPVENVKIGDTFIVKPGDRIPLDGIVVKGTSYLDTASITGESKPRKVIEKDTVISGCINTKSVLTIKATSTSKNSTAQRIIELMEQQEEKKSDTEKWITKFAKIYTPTVIAIGALIFIIPVILGMDIKECLYRALVFIVTSCPCALVISVPLGYFCGIGKASREGILIKGAKELESLKLIDYILLDKTGTITEGVMTVSEINTDMDKKEFLLLLASAEENSNHLIADAIKKKNKQKVKEVKDYKEIEGRGISCKIGRKEILIGNDLLMEDNNIKYEPLKSNNTVVYCAINKKYVGNVVISDVIKKTSLKIKGKWKNMVILSGDNRYIVQDVANKLGIKTYYGELLPEDKVRITEIFKGKGKTLFVGDGINDAPVLAAADLGASLGGVGTDAALEASDIVLMDDDLNKVFEAISISKYTHKKVKQSVGFALTVKLIVLILGILGISTITMAVFADVGVTLLSVINVLLILIKKKEV